ncbi:kinesin-like protein KIF24 isoform X2 [Paralichthys olivaceus]
MTLCLNECLRAVGLQHHYARFTSMGVCLAAHLSALTMEDYPLLGIRTMEERTRLFHLVQMIKTLDLESLEYEDGYDDYGADGGDEGSAVVDSSFTYDGYGGPVRRRLNFGSETTDQHRKKLSYPKGSVHVCTSHMGNDVPVQCRGSATTLQLELNSGRAVKCGCKENDNHRTDAHCHPSNQHTRRDSTGGIAVQNSPTRSSPKCGSFQKQKHRPEPVKMFNSQPVGHKERKRILKKEKLPTEIQSNGASGSMAKKTPIYESKRTTGYNYGLPLSSPPAPNKKHEGEQRISVCVRKRPLTRAQSRRGEADVVTTSDGECVIVHESKEAVDLTQYILQHRFYFDQVFGEESSNEEVYQRTAYPLVQHMLNGGKATCFAYGQTGAGKTHTMLGSSAGGPGLYALAVRDIFAHLSTSRMLSPLLVYVSFFEIYCGQLYDLLDHRKRLFAREDGQKVVHIAGLRDVRVDSVSSLLQVISQGTEERTQGMSGVNPLSSRSHALLQIQLRCPNQQIRGRMWFVDLAGSERASDTKDPDKQSRMEGAEINQSLLVLKECIRSLDQEQSHTPFRQSKLTQVLKDSFVGDSMTCMIANISPGHLATEHTLNTLRYADRVKELRGQRGLRGGRRGKTMPSPKHNLSNSSSGSSVGPRGKSPPKKQKLGRQPEAFAPTSPNTRSSTGDTNLCSTPKNSRWRAETSAMGREGIGLEHVTPIRGWLGLGDTRHKHEASESNAVCLGINRHSGGDHNVRAGTVLVPPSDKHRLLTEVRNPLTQRESGKREEEIQQSSVEGAREEEGGWLQQRRQVERCRDPRSEVEKLRGRDLHMFDEKDKERQRHLRMYHQQLQQFTSSSPSSSVNLLSPSTFSSSLHSSVSPLSSSPLPQDSHLSASALTYQDVEDVYRAGVQIRADANRGRRPFPSGEIRCNNNHARGESGGVGAHCTVSWGGTEGRPEQGESDKRRSVEQTCEARLKREDKRPAGIEERDRRWAWLATVETEQEDRVTGAMPTDAGAQVSYSCRSDDRRQRGEEGLHPTNDPAEQSTDRERGSPHQRAPAERPLSPACEHIHTLPTPNKRSDRSLESKHTRCISNIPPLPLQNASFSNSPLTTQQLSTSVTQSRYKAAEPDKKLSESPVYTQNHSHIKAKIAFLSQHETDTDSLSYTMDPLSLSMLQVDQQAATSSFLQGEQIYPSLCLLGNERGKNTQRKVEKEQQTCDKLAEAEAKAEDVDIHLSFLKLPQAKTYCPTTSDTVINHTDRRKDTRRIGRTKPALPEVTLVRLQDRENNQKLQTMPVLSTKAPSSPLKPSSCSPMQAPHVHVLPSSHNVNPNVATQMPTEHAHNMHSKPDSSTSKPQSDGVLDQCHIVNSNHSIDNATQPGQESTSNQLSRPTIHPSSLKDLNHALCRVVQAHWEQLEEMEALCHREGTLLFQQPDMAFGEYVHKLEEIMEKKALCVHSMRAQLQPYLMLSQSNQTQSMRR